MAITSAQQSAVFKLAVGLFNAAPGGFYNSVAGILLSSKDAAAAADALIATDAFQAIIPSNLLTNDQFAARLVENLVGNYASATDKAWATAQIVGQLNGGASQGTAAYWAIDALSKVPTTGSSWSPAAAALLNKISVASYYTVEAPVTSQDLHTLQSLLIDVTDRADSVVVAKTALSHSVNLSTAVETTEGTAGNDTFKAFLANGANTLQSGDVIRGGAGTDTLLADVSTQGFNENAIAFESNQVENVILRAQHATDAANNGDNNLGAAKVAIDAERAAAVESWQDYNSRADLIIEDVRIADGKQTSSVTLVMESTDPGNVDFGVYFDQHSLRNAGTSKSLLNVLVMDVASVQAGGAPLKDLSFAGYSFYANGNLVELRDPSIDAAQTYADLKAAFEKSLKVAIVNGAVQDLSGSVSVSLSDPVNFTTEAGKGTTSASVAANFQGQTGQILTLTANASIAISNTATGKPDAGWLTTGTAPSTGAIVQTFNTGSSSTSALVTSTIVLDDVGRGSTGGDLVVGGMSVGATSTSRGVERFEIEVRDNSKLQTINSTNDSLREVTIKNGVTTNTELNQGAYDKTATNAGNLTVNGNANPTNAVQGQVIVGTNSDTKLPGLDDAHHNGKYGFTDVRLIDGSAMTGKLAFTAQITANTINKYINLVDTQSNPAGDITGAGNTNYNVKGANFDYRGGHNNDTISVDIDAAAAASRSKILSGQSDFTFNVDGGDGDDAITVKVVNAGLTGGGADNEAWYSNQNLNYSNQNLNNNITIKAGTGNDTIRIPGAGDVTIDAGDGNDAVFSDNTGVQGDLTLTAASHLLSNPGVSATTSNAVWVYNTAMQNAGALRLQDVNDLRSDVNNSYNLYKAQLQVSFKGLASQKITLQNAETYTVTDLDINQAIKNAINNPDSILSKLLVAKDGPANSLVIESLIDGVMNGVAEVPSVTITAPLAADLNATEVTTMAGKWGVIASQTASATAADAVTYMTNGGGATFSGAGAVAGKSLADFTTKADYVADEATDGATQIIGADSSAISDNFITPGAGDDLVVLGTTVGADTAHSSNEVVTYSGSFGNDTIVNFAVAGNGIDYLDLTSYLGGNATAVGAGPSVVNKAVQVVDVVTVGGTANDTAEKIKALYDANDNTTAGTTVKQVYVTLDTATHNVGTLYSVVDGAADNDTVVTKVGTIDLADVDWRTLTVSNFTVPSVTADGPTVNITTGNTYAVATGATSQAGSLLNDTFNVAAGNTGTLTGAGGNDTFNYNGASTNTIADLNSGDVVNFVAGGSTVTSTALNLTGVTVGGTGAAASHFVLTGTAGADTIVGSSIADTINGGADNDTITGGAGDDTITGGAGDDTITGGAGNDTINVDAGTDTIADLATGDILNVSAGATATANNVAAFVATAATANAGTATLNSDAAGSTVDMALATGANGFTLTGGAGVDTLTGSAQADTINGGAGADIITGGAGADTITLGTGADHVVFNSLVGADTVTDFSLVDVDVLDFSIAGLGLNGADYAAGAVTVINAAAAAALGAGAWNNHIVVDTAANIAALTIGAGSATGGVLAVASDTGAISFDADGNFAAGSVLIGTLTGGAAVIAADLGIVG